MKILIGFSRPRKFNIISWLIRAYMGFTPYSHTYIRFYMPGIQRWVIYEASHGDVHFEEFTNWTSRSQVIEEYDLVLDERHWHEVLQFCIDNSNKLYGFLTLIGILLKKKLGFDGNKSFICSELVAKAIQIPNADDFITPAMVKEYVIKNQIMI